MDLARSGGRPGRAVSLLETFLRHHASDARAPLAAFTLGRLQLTELHRPRRAARAFARARSLSPAGILAEDAVAREVEAWAVAGELQRARAVARVYLRHYPSGRRIAAVRRYADLD
jgi:TolA-binding protein